MHTFNKDLVNLLTGSTLMQKFNQKSPVVRRRRRLRKTTPRLHAEAFKIYMRRHAEATRRDFVNIHATAPSVPPSCGRITNHAEATRRGCVNIHATPASARLCKYTSDFAVCAAKLRPSFQPHEARRLLRVHTEALHI
jgi:hypothetical protein